MANYVYTVPLADFASNAIYADDAGNANTAFNLDASSNANLYIGGGTNGQALLSDGAGNLNWANVGTGNGTVTNIATTGSGLGFTLTGGPITTTGTVTLTVPSATTLRTNLTIGNVANLNLNSNASTYLNGNGNFTVPSGTYSNSNVANYLPSYTGNLQAGNLSIIGGWANFAGNVVAANLLGGANLSVTGTAAINGNLTVANANLGNLATANYFSGNGSLLTGIVANFANYAGNVTVSSQPNITSVGTLVSLSVSGNANIGNIGAGIITTTGNIIGANINTGGQVSASGNVIANYFIGNGSSLTNITGANVTGQVNYANMANYAGNVTIAAQSNITSLGTLSGLTVSGSTTLSTANITKATLLGNSSTTALVFPNAQEPVTVNASGATGTINYDLATQSILYYAGNATGNVTLNFRGSSGTSLSSFLQPNNSMTCAFLVTNGATPYYVAQHQIDGTNITPLWLGNVTPNTGDANSIDAYTYTIINNSGTYTVLAALTQYK